VWLKEGVYARYEFESGGIIFSNGTWEHSDSHAVFEWRCVSFEGEMAKLNVSIRFDHTIQFSTHVYVNVETRNVTLLDGTYVGKNWLWLPANPSKNETLRLEDNTTIKVDTGGSAPTCQGTQKCFFIMNRGTTYDLDTGILVSSGFTGEPILRALNISDITGVAYFAATNIDLGPREWLIDLLYAIPFTLPFIAFIIIFAFLLHKRQQKKKRKMALKTKQNKHAL